MAARLEPLPPFLDKAKAAGPDRCGNCRYWLPATAGDAEGNGLCRRHPPTVVNNLHGHAMNETKLDAFAAAEDPMASAFPGTLAYDWCGEHAAPPVREG